MSTGTERVEISAWRATGWSATSAKMDKVVVHASTVEDARRAVARLGIIDARIRRSSPASDIASLQIGKTRVKQKHVNSALRSLATAAGAGMDMLGALSAMAKATRRGSPMRRTVEDIRARIGAGEELEGAFAAHEDIFGPTVAPTIAAGMKSGTLPEVLNALSDSSERASTIRGQVKGALFYPVMVLVMAMGVAVFAALVMIPQMEALLVDLGGELPLPTKVMLAFSAFLTTQPLRLVVVIVLAWVLATSVLRLEFVRSLRSRLSLSIPLVGRVVHGMNTATLCDLVAVLMTAGVEPVSLATLAAGSVRNGHMASALQGVPEMLLDDKDLEGALNAFVPPLDEMVPVLASQSASGTKDPGQPWRNFARLTHESTDRLAKGLTQALNPIMMLVVGSVVLFIAAAVYGPMLSIYQSAI